MVNPKILCNRHLLGEHAECHMFAAGLIRKTKITNYIKFNLLQPDALAQRHQALAGEMLSRKMNHNSPLPTYDIQHLPKHQQNYKVKVNLSLKDLLDRCPKCRQRFRRLKKNSS